MHNEFPNKELRVYFSAKIDKQATYSINTNDDIFGQINKQIILNKIDFYTNYQKLLQTKLSILLLMEEKGWKDWDVSDYIAITGANYMNFIGTKKEYDTLVSQNTDK